MSERPTPQPHGDRPADAWTAPGRWGGPSGQSPQAASDRPAADPSTAAYPNATPSAAGQYPDPRPGQDGGTFAAGYGYVPADPRLQPADPSGHQFGYQAGRGGGYGGPYPDFPQANPPRSEPKRPRVWLAVSTAAVLAAALASGGTAALLNDEEPAASGVTQTTQTTQAVAGAPDWGTVATDVRPAVVAIKVATGAGEALGSGVVIDGQGHIATNNHVVDGARKVQVTMSDGRIIPAEIVGTDPTTDLAVIKLSKVPKDLVAATLGTSADLTVGQPVMAVGNPLGLDSTVTTGIISALDRPVRASDGQGAQPTITNAIQVDAAINPGNSGGALFDSGGKVVGINSSIATTSQTSGSIGLGFAIPVDLVTDISDQLISDGVAQHAFLGVSMTDAVASADGMARTGARVEQVQSGTPADEAGVEPGDVIVAIDDHTVASAESLTGFVRQYQSGDDVKLTVVRSGKELTLDATLATRVETN